MTSTILQKAVGAVLIIGASHSLLLTAPGWIRTALGGPKALFSMEETVPRIVSTLLAQRGQPGLRYLDREGSTVLW